ncbi:MAG: serine/threonine protein kinase [Elainellaceae cyanobacterium]
MAGQILGDRYQIEKQLGNKAGRWTLLATDLAANQPVILKLISIDEELHPDALRLFQREIQTLQRLSHPAIPQYLSCFDVDLARNRKALVLIESYIGGTSADRYLKQGRTFSEKEAKQIGAGILEILVYLHNQSPPILHRDIKPSNIVLSTPPGQRTRIYLIDFGSVKPGVPGQGYSTALTLLGTHQYTAPEQLGGRVLKTSDLYSLGLTLMTLITGQSVKQSALIPRQNDIKCLTLSPRFTAWLQRMSDRDPKGRPASAQLALDELHQMV